MSDLSAKILSSQDIESELVEVPQWGVTVLVKSMTAKDRSIMISNALESSGDFNVQQVLPDLVLLCTYDPETGERVFQDSDRDALVSKSAAPIEAIANVAMRLSGMLDGAVDAAGKDSSPTVTDASSTN
jgi:hypothetical protein